jgi:hypothetical protein
MTAFEMWGAPLQVSVIASEAKQSTPPQNEDWIASSLALPCANAFAFVAGNDEKRRPP